MNQSANNDPMETKATTVPTKRQTVAQTPSPKMKYIQLALTPETHRQLKATAAQRDMTMQDFVVDAITVAFEGR